MAAASVDAPLGEEDKIKIIAEAYRPFLIDVLDVRDIVERLKIQFDGDDVRFTHVLELIEKGETRSRLTECFLDALAEKKDHQGLYRAVIDALFYSGNERIADHIEGTSQFDTKRWEQYRSFLKLYASRLEDIEPLLLLGSLNEHLNPRDLETIRKKVQNEGNRAGASELLLRLDRKSEDCFKAFIKALEENGFRFLARDMEEMTNFALGISTDDEEANDDHEDNDEEIPEGDNMSDGEVKKLTLRSYQEEVLTPALKGQNAMVVLPTGKGKTEVAIALISRRFLPRDAVAGAGATSHRRQKCVFVVNKVPLVKQQKDRCLKYLKGTCRVAGTSGEDLNNVPLNTIIDDNDITVLTAQVLVNALEDENIKLSDIALLVLDECHHCQKSNPYNVLMAMYRDLKLNSPRLPRPQILGLTASPGVGDSKNLVQAQEYITKLCANLDCRISRPKIYAHQLNKGKSPEEIFLIVKGRSLEDRYFREIGVIMERIEDNIKVLEAGRKLVEETDKFSKVASRRGTQSYEQGVINLKKSIQQRVENEDDRRELMTCVSYLREYNNSLYINRDVRTSDAISYMEDYIDEEERSKSSGPADIRLKNMFREKLDVLRRIANLHDNINPVLNELGKQLKTEYGKKKDSLSIIFTKTRDSAKALVKWLNEDPDLKHLNAEVLIGGGSQGMTSAEQNRNLHLFANKTCRVLVATSIAEEGLDIRECNMVFRYNYVTSDIGHIQTKGRSRADFGGKIFVIVNSDLQLQDRELKNIIRVKMMNEVVQGIAESTLKNGKKFDDQILMEQKRDQKERQREKENARIKAKKEEKSGILLRCIKCYREACSLDDVKSIHNQHHVVINDLFLSKMKLVELKKQPLVDEMRFQKKVHCSNCRYKWGKLVMYRQQKFPLIDISNFEMKDGNGRKWYAKAWKEVPFVIQSIDLDDLGEQNNLSAQTGAQEEGLHQENEEEEEDDVFLEYSNIMQLDD